MFLFVFVNEQAEVPRMIFFFNRCIGEGHVQTGHATPTAPATRKKRCLFKELWRWCTSTESGSGRVEWTWCFFCQLVLPFGMQLPPLFLFGWWFSNIFLFSTKLGEMIQVDDCAYFSNGLVQPPPSYSGYRYMLIHLMG